MSGAATGEMVGCGAGVGGAARRRREPLGGVWGGEGVDK